MMFRVEKCSAQPRSKPVCNETSAGITQRHHVDTTAPPRWYFNCSAYPQHTKDPKLRSGCRLLHDRMNFKHLQIRSSHAHHPFNVFCHRLSSFSTSLRPSSTATRATLCASTGFKIGWKRVEPAWRNFGNSFNERLRQNLRGNFGNSFNERLRQRGSSTILGCAHCLHQFHPARSPPTVLSRKHPTSKHSTRVSHDSRAQVEARLSPISSFSISSDQCAGDGLCWKLCKSARQRMSFSAADSRLVFCAVRPPLCLCAIASTTLRPPSRDPRRTITGGPFPRFPSSGRDFRCRTSGSFLDCQVSREFNVQRQRGSCEPSSISRDTLKRSGVIKFRVHTLLTFETDPSSVFLGHQVGGAF